MTIEVSKNGTVRAVWAACLMGLLSGCSWVGFPGRETFVSSYQPSNVHLEEKALPSEIKRVAGHPDTAQSVASERAVLQSPRRFARYTASAVVATLPPRELKN